MGVNLVEIDHPLFRKSGRVLSESLMRDERGRRRPEFCPGIELRLADGQIWSLPLPVKPIDEQELPFDPGKAEVGWDDLTYREIVRAACEAEDEGDLFRAEMALAIHLLNWNYVLDADDFEAILDNHGASRSRANLSDAFHTLALAHFGPFTTLGEKATDCAIPPGRGEARRVSARDALRIFGREKSRDVEGSVDLTA